MSFLEELKDFQNLGCTDLTKCALACQVYRDLIKDPEIADLEKLYDSALNLLYLRGQRGGNTVSFVPVLSCQELDFNNIEEIQSKLAGGERGAHKSVTLAISDTSSTILYYQVSSDVLERNT